MPRKPTDIRQLKLRLPEAMRRKLERASDKSGRSLNNEVLWRLGQSFATEGDDTVLKLAQDQSDFDANTKKKIEEIVKQLINKRED